MLLNSLRVPITYAYYYVDYEGFIEKYCINITKPELQCNGKCHLNKVVNDNTESDENPIKIIDFKEINLFVVAQTTYNFISFLSEKPQIIDGLNLYSYSRIYRFDHPPQL